MSDLPDPLTPADCDLSGMPFMPLFVTKVLQSATYGLSNGDEFKAAFTLWCASWLEVPAASLPNDDRMLEYLSRSKNWKKVKAMALRGWVLCSDGRLYHSVVAAGATEAWEKRTDYREKEDNKTTRQKRWREQCAKLANELRELGIVPPRGASLETLRALLDEQGVDANVDGAASTHVDGVDKCSDDVEIGKTGTVKGQGQLTPIPPTSDESRDDLIDATGKLSIAMRSHGIKSNPGDMQLKALAAAGVTPAEVSSACEIAKEAKPGQAISAVYVMGILKRGLQDAALVRDNRKPPARKDWE